MKGWKRVLLIIVPFFLTVGTLVFLGSLIIGINLLNLEAELTSMQLLVLYVFAFLGAFLVLWIFMKFVDKEPFIKLGFQTKNRLNEFITGIITGLAIMVIAFFTLIFLKEIFFIRIGFDLKELLIAIGLYSMAAVLEESLFRGYFLKNLMLSFNKYIALIISSIIFALLHGLNPDINIIPLLNLFLAGIVLGASYIYTKNLWFPIALHYSWNFFQALLGFNVSGFDFFKIVEFRIEEYTLLNGGGFGFEGSYLASIAVMIIIIGIFIYYEKHEPQQLQKSTETEG